MFHQTSQMIQERKDKTSKDSSTSK
jgi:hypothetical protein